MNRALHLLRTWSHKLSVTFRLDKMSREFMIFINSYFCFAIGTTISNIFISTFLFKSGGEMSTVALYYLTYYFFEMLAIYLVVRFSHRVSNVHFAVLGIILHVVAYLILLIAQKNSVDIYPIIGLVCGLGGGLYWTGYHTLIQVYTTNENRQYGMSYSGLINNLIVLTAPTLSGIVLISVPGIWGYMIVFGVAFLFFVWAAIVIRKLRAEHKNSERRKLFATIREHWSGKILNYSMICEFIRGLRNGVYAYYFNILIFSMTSNEFVLGLTTTVKGAVAMLIFYLIGRRVLGRKLRMGLFLAASIVGIIITSSLLIWFTAVAVIVYSVLDGATMVIMDNYANLTGFEVAKCTSTKKDLRMENVALRLISLELGRIVGITTSLFLPLSGNGIIIFFIILCLLNLPVWAMYKKAAELCEEKEHEVVVV